MRTAVKAYDAITKNIIQSIARKMHKRFKFFTLQNYEHWWVRRY